MRDIADGTRPGAVARARTTRDKKIAPNTRATTHPWVGCDSLDLDFHLGVPPVRFHNTLPRVSVSPVTQHHD